MKRLYTCPVEKKKDLLSVLESDPYAEHSFSKIGYILRDGKSLGENPDMLYLYVSAHDDIIKELDSKMQGIAGIVEGDDAGRIIIKIENERNNAAEGLGNIFG